MSHDHAQPPAPARHRPPPTGRVRLYALAAILAVVAIVAGAALYDRYASGWSVTDHTVTYFGKGDIKAGHYRGAILYQEVPPVGGPHSPVPQMCGFYSGYIGNEHAVHSLEHGAVWIAYDPNLPAADIDTLRQVAAQPYTLVSPYPGLDTAIVLSAWGHQLRLDDVDTDKIDAFMREYRNSATYTPEFGASCAGGVDETTDATPQQDPYVQPDGYAAIGGIRDVDATATAEAGGTPAAG